MIYERIKKYTTLWLVGILDQLFPYTCKVCGAHGVSACTTCLQQLQAPKPYHHAWIISGWNYHDPHMEGLIRHIKNHPDTPMVHCMVSHLITCRWMKVHPHETLNHLWENISLDFNEKPLVIPLPLHTSRFRDRGYNQSEIIGRVFAHLWELPFFSHILIKHRATPKQGTAPSRAARLHNVEDSFHVEHAHLILGRTIILVDDVCTTGATLDTARTCLLAAGAREVVAFTLAN